MDIVEQHIVDTIVAIRSASQKPDAESLSNLFQRTTLATLQCLILWML